MTDSIQFLVTCDLFLYLIYIQTENDIILSVIHVGMYVYKNIHLSMVCDTDKWTKKLIVLNW